MLLEEKRARLANSINNAYLELRETSYAVMAGASLACDFALHQRLVSNSKVYRISLTSPQAAVRFSLKAALCTAGAGAKAVKIITTKALTPGTPDPLSTRHTTIREQRAGPQGPETERSRKRNSQHAPATRKGTNPDRPDPRQPDSGPNTDPTDPTDPEEPMSTPQEIASQHQLPIQRALIDFDPLQPVKQVIGADPINLSGIPTEPVSSLITPWAIVTITAHHGDGQLIADLLAQPRAPIKNLVINYAEHYFQQGIMDFALNAMSNEQIRNIQHNTGHRLPPDLIDQLPEDTG